MNNDLISRSELKKAIMNDLGLGDEENGSDAEYMSGLQDCYNLIDNAPTVEPEVYMNGKDYNIYLEGYKQGKKDFERPQGEIVIKCKDCKYQVKEWREDKRMKDKGYWVYGCEHFGEIMGYWGFGGNDNEFCSDAERKGGAE